MPIETRTLVIAAVVVIVLVLLRRLAGRRKVGPSHHAAGPLDRAEAGEGGWAALAARWPASEEAVPPIAAHATIGLGRVRWRNCVRVAADPSGLRLEVAVPLLGRMGTRPVKLPWSALGEGRETLLYGASALLFPVGTPSVATLVLPTELWRLLEAARAPSDPSKTKTDRSEITDPPR